MRCESRGDRRPAGVDEFAGYGSRRVLDHEDLDRRVERFFSRCSTCPRLSVFVGEPEVGAGGEDCSSAAGLAQDAAAVSRIAKVLHGLGHTDAGLSITTGIGSFVPDAISCIAAIRKLWWP